MINGELKVKGLGPLIGIGDLVKFKDTENVRKKGLTPNTGGEIVKVNKSGSVVVKATTKRSEYARIT